MSTLTPQEVQNCNEDWEEMQRKKKEDQWPPLSFHSSLNGFFWRGRHYAKRIIKLFKRASLRGGSHSYEAPRIILLDCETFSYTFSEHWLGHCNFLDSPKPNVGDCNYFTERDKSKDLVEGLHGALRTEDPKLLVALAKKMPSSTSIKDMADHFYKFFLNVFSKEKCGLGTEPSSVYKDDLKKLKVRSRWRHIITFMSIILDALQWTVESDLLFDEKDTSGDTWLKANSITRPRRHPSFYKSVRTCLVAVRKAVATEAFAPAVAEMEEAKTFSDGSYLEERVEALHIESRRILRSVQFR